MIGQGNVALDVARMLLTPTDHLKVLVREHVHVHVRTVTYSGTVFTRTCTALIILIRSMSPSVYFIKVKVLTLHEHNNAKVLRPLCRSCYIYMHDCTLLCIIIQTTDICQHALEQLAESKVRRVQLVGKSGPLQVTFTIRELREMAKLPGCRALLDASDFDHCRGLIPGNM